MEGHPAFMSGFLDNLLIVICTSGGEKQCACDLSYVRLGFSVINKQERENAECFDNGITIRRPGEIRLKRETL